jgi:hypothetical protein
MTEGQNTFSQANAYVNLETVRGTVSAKAVYFSKIAKQLKNKALHLVVMETKKQALFFEITTPSSETLIINRTHIGYRGALQFLERIYSASVGGK